MTYDKIINKMSLGKISFYQTSILAGLSFGVMTQYLSDWSIYGLFLKT